MLISIIFSIFLADTTPRKFKLAGRITWKKMEKERERGRERDGNDEERFGRISSGNDCMN